MAVFKLNGQVVDKAIAFAAYEVPAPVMVAPDAPAKAKTGVKKGPKVHTITDMKSFKWWRLDQPGQHKLVREIIFRWRGTSAMVPGKLGHWAVYPIERWCEWTGLSRDQVKRALKDLVAMGMIERERHRFAGTDVRAFMRPTKLAITFLGKPGDALKLPATSPSQHMHFAPTTAPTTAPISAPTTAPTHSLPFPSSSTNSTHTGKEISGGAWEGGKEMKPTQVVPFEKAPPSPPTSDDAALEQYMLDALAWSYESAGSKVDAAWKADLAKQAKIEAQAMPALYGPHEAFVKHPAAKKPKAWAGLSKVKKMEYYKKYTVCVSNWYGAHGKKGLHPAEEITDEEWSEVYAGIGKL